MSRRMFLKSMGAIAAAAATGSIQRSFRPFKLKSKPDDKGIFEGYGSVFGVKDSYDEIIVKGAFKDTLAKHKADGTMPKMLWQHMWSQPIGVWLEMREDDVGLFVRGQLLKDEVQQAKEAYALLKAGALDGMSIGYVPQAWEKNAEDEDVTDLTRIDLWENSVVTFPANPEARVTDVRSRDVTRMTVREFEDLLRDAGFSERAAVKIAARGFKARDEARDEPGAETALGEVLAALNRNTTTLKGNA